MKQSSIRLNRSLFIDSVRQARKILEFFVIKNKKNNTYFISIKVDVYDGPDGAPRIFHQKTLTSKMLFEDALIVIKNYGFKLSE